MYIFRNDPDWQLYRSLTSSHREADVFYLRYRHNRTFHQIKDTLGIAYGTTHENWEKAREKIDRGLLEMLRQMQPYRYQALNGRCTMEGGSNGAA